MSEVGVGRKARARILARCSSEKSELDTLREQVNVLREALGKIADATIEGIDGDEWFNDIANIALEQTKPRDGE